MRNHVQRGDTVTLTAPAALASGEPFAVGAIFGVATGDAASGAQVEASRVGVFDLPKATGASWSVGDRLYWDATAKNVTKVETDNLFIGAALAAAASGATTGRVLLAGNVAPTPVSA
jgi:predicted RecA/RadA family phage recombinase